MMLPAIALLTFVTLQRLAELVHAKRNTKALMAQGGREIGAEHYPYMVVMHAAWLVGLWIFGWNQPIDLFWLAIFAVLQLLRVWILATLGGRWTTRIIVLPDTPRIVTGPYRFLSHPNYVIVVGEIAAMPLAFGLPLFALVFSLLNAAMLTVRIKAENKALKDAML
ncbi:isoprenylcysteine carboxyl methyltransferase family protein [Rhizobium tumorigenes]|uniref:Isoprenylcysteine carboxylmethyltransferase family protein n=1 Tax=Rhizobium tumorigenes TaxID=2041385 RepID=A0AAF1KS20_9HYPH|nr:isoprenylcysteine carboxylmethyltransferase family protein [Rhizobium tumorigenes]WFR97377.1 isoprenylcysteine carboxylmethyltransferase family protein [Rhizobium tumorigenes]